MSDEPREVDGSGYTYGGGHVFDGSEHPWDAEPISIPFEWTVSDGTTGPIRDGVVIGGMYDGLRVAPSHPLSLAIGPVTVRWKFMDSDGNVIAEGSTP